MRIALILIVSSLLACSSKDAEDTTDASSAGGGGEQSLGGSGGEPAIGGSAGAGGDAGGAATCQGPAWPSNAACESCQNEKCCVTGANCVADPECVAIMECAVEGGQDCTEGHADGIWNYSGIVVCLQNACASECSIAPATCGGIQPTPASCTDEVNDACCAETTACGESDACVAFIYQCIDQNECATEACYEDCLARYPDAKAPFETMAACWSSVPCLGG